MIREVKDSPLNWRWFTRLTVVDQIGIFYIFSLCTTSICCPVHISHQITFCCAEITEMLPSILNQLGADSFTHLKKLSQVAGNVSSCCDSQPMIVTMLQTTHVSLSAYQVNYCYN